MPLVSFNAFRTLGFPDTTVLKPEHYLQHKALLQEADWVLFPEYWQLNALVHGLKCRVFPSIASYRIGHDKVEMTRAFQTVASEYTPWTMIEADGPLERDMIWDAMGLPFVARLPKASMGEGVWLIETREDWRRYCERTEVLYAQEYLPIDRDVRVVVIGDEVLTAYWRTQADQGFYNNVARGGDQPGPAACPGVGRGSCRVRHRPGGRLSLCTGIQPTVWQQGSGQGHRPAAGHPGLSETTDRAPGPGRPHRATVVAGGGLSSRFHANFRAITHWPCLFYLWVDMRICGDRRKAR